MPVATCFTRRFSGSADVIRVCKKLIRPFKNPSHVIPQSCDVSFQGQASQMQCRHMLYPWPGPHTANETLDLKVMSKQIEAHNVIEHDNI